MKFCFFQAHPDDLELNTPYLIHYLTGQRHDIRIASLTKGEFGLPGFQYDKYKGPRLAAIRVKEFYNAAAIHGIKPEQVDWLGYTDGFVELDRSLIEDIARYLQKHRPDVVVAPEAVYTWYYHKDHINTGRAVYSAIRKRLIDFTPRLYFYTTLSPNWFFPVDSSQLGLVERLIACHKTQAWLLDRMKILNKPFWLFSGLHVQGYRYAEGYRRVYFGEKSRGRNRAGCVVRGLVRLISSNSSVFDAKYPEEVLKQLGKA